MPTVVNANKPITMAQCLRKLERAYTKQSLENEELRSITNSAHLEVSDLQLQIKLLKKQIRELKKCASSK